MRAAITLSALILMGLGLSGCAVAEAGGAVIGGAARVVGTAASVAGDIVTAPIDAVSGGSSDKKKSKDD